jgi:serine kinase of HPr protein (carbohydrate metabolism regulator)
MARAMSDAITVHATTIAIDGVAVVLRGRPGAGKSDLALRLIDQGAGLVADDQTALVRRGDGVVVASAPPTIAGRLEVRGLGIVEMPAMRDVPVGLVVDLVGPPAIERLPEPATAALLGVALPWLQLDPGAPSAAAKVRLAVRQLRGDRMAPP